MSTIALDAKIFVSVCNKLQNMAVKIYPYQIYKTFGEQHVHTTDVEWLDKVDRKVSEFINRLYDYNRQTYTLQYTYGTFEEKVKALFLNDVQKAQQYEYISGLQPVQLTDEQCFMYLHCISYNSDIDGWGAEDYFSQEYMDQYQKDMDALTDIINQMANHIAMEAATKSGCQWASL